jgi:hypothetical protein
MSSDGAGAGSRAELDEERAASCAESTRSRSWLQWCAARIHSLTLVATMHADANPVTGARGYDGLLAGVP